LANELNQYACQVGARFIGDDVLRAQFTQEVALVGRAVVDDVRLGRSTPEQARTELRREYAQLYAEVEEFGKLAVGLTAGILQIGTGVAICKLSIGVGCVLGGGSMILHGVNNVYENGLNIYYRRKTTVGPVRKGYQKLALMVGGRESQGNVAYGLADLGLSAFNLSRMTLKSGSWRLFRYIEADKVRAYKDMGKGVIMFEVGVDMLTGDQVLIEWKKE
jgi:hypothetical protein